VKVNIKLFIAVSFVSSIVCESNAQRLDRFGGVNKYSYNKIVTYFGYADSLSKPDEVRNDTGYYHMYFWLSDSVAELAARMISPVPVVVMPDRGDLVSENYYANEKDKTYYFDPWISIERANGITEQKDIAKSKSSTWIQLGFNDDSNELFAQPSGNHYNSLIRIKRRNDIGQKPFTPGLYRVRFTAYKKGKVRGSYLLQIGTTTILPLKLVKDPEELKN
jgi:hypothetical protein